MSAISLDKQKIIELSSELCLTTDWQKNTIHLRSLIEKYAPFAELACYWSQLGEHLFVTDGAENLFKNHFKEIKRSDMVQAKELISLNNPSLPDTFAIAINLEGSYLGMLLLRVADLSEKELTLDLLKDLVKVILPQLALARYATVMAQEVEKRTSTDKLTGLWNRTYFNERFREECIRLSRTKEQGTVVVLALDELAAMAKVMSAEEHTKLIVHASNLVRSSVRQTDWIVYWDRHEILIYLTNTQPENSIEVMSRCVNQLLNAHPLLQPVMGLCSTSETNSARALIQLAARRLDLARKDGRRMVICFATRDGLKFLQLASPPDDGEKNGKRKENKTTKSS